jgi:hypothetical protein
MRRSIKSALTAKVVLLTGIAAFSFLGNDPVKAQSVLQDGTAVAGHLVTSPPPAGGPPVGTSCTMVAGSTDTMGQCAATATSAVAVIFNKPFAKAPFCVVLDHTTASGNALVTEPTTTTFVMGTTVSGDKISWHCEGQVGN